MSDAGNETDFHIGPSAIKAYSRLSYTMWYALAEFIDNSTQSRKNYGSLIDDVLKTEQQPLIVSINHDRLNRTLTIKDNSIGMTREDLVNALRIAEPTKDSRGRSKYGMGLKTAACWIGKNWKVVTTEWGTPEEWTAEIDVDGIATEGKRIPLTPRSVGADEHYTHVIIKDLHRNIQKRTEETIRWYLGSMYRYDLKEGLLRLLYNSEEITALEDYDIDSDPAGNAMRRELPETIINGKKVNGWVAVMRKGGRKYGGFSLFQERRQIQGFPNAWKPKSIFGGIDDEGGNNLIAQRLTGVLELDGFRVSHTKDAILFDDTEEEELEKLLYDFTTEFRNYASKRRGNKNQPWSRDRVKELVEAMKSEFSSGEMKDAVVSAVLPPFETIVKNNQQQVASLAPEEQIASIDVMADLKLIVSIQEKSEHEPYVTIAAGAAPGVIHVILNGLHPYFCSLESTDAIDECIHQYLYDAIAEYRVTKQNARLNPDSVRRVKNELLRVQTVRIENAAAAIQQGGFEQIVGSSAQ